MVDEGARNVRNAVRVGYAGGGHEENVAPRQLDGRDGIRRGSASVEAVRNIRNERVLRAVEGLLQIAVELYGSIGSEKEQKEEERRGTRRALRTDKVAALLQDQSRC